MHNIDTLDNYMGMTNMVDPLEWAYYTRLSSAQWSKAKVLARRLTQKLTATKYSDYIKNCGPVEKAGECIVKHFFDYYLDSRATEDYIHLDPYSGGFVVNGKSVDVHTRMLKFSQAAKPMCPVCHTTNVAATYNIAMCWNCGNSFVPTPPSKLNKSKFLVMVPELGLARKADVYIYCGFDVVSRDGYAFGWVTSSMLDLIDVNYDYKHPAKCFTLSQIYPMWELTSYLGG